MIPGRAPASPDERARALRDHFRDGGVQELVPIAVTVGPPGTEDLRELIREFFTAFDDAVLMLPVRSRASVETSLKMFPRLVRAEATLRAAGAPATEQDDDFGTEHAGRRGAAPSWLTRAWRRMTGGRS